MISLLLNHPAPRTELQQTNRRRSKQRFIKGCAALGLVSALSAPTHKPIRRALRRRLWRLGKRQFLPPFVADAVVGAIGEIGQLAILYPLNTIKVRCQAQGTSAGAVWGRLYAQGLSMRTLSSLFAGCLPSAVCAALVGACYLASFSTAKRGLDSWHARSLVQNRSSQAGNSTDSCMDLQEDAQIATGEAQHSQETSGVTAGSPANDTAAALIASLITSVLEAPVELFRHRMQAGVMKGSMLRNMTSAYGLEGLTSLYWNFFPFLLKGIPYDVAELFSYSQLTEKQMTLPALKHCPEAFRDCAIGALAGAVAVICSMPADAINIRLELSSSRPPPGIHNATLAFIRSGRSIVAESGIRGLFRGIQPRLLETVPSTMFYWLLVATLRRTLQPYVIQQNLPTVNRTPKLGLDAGDA